MIYGASVKETFMTGACESELRRAPHEVLLFRFVVTVANLSFTFR
eukprot:COSAG02_NODE_3739_length_6303_cov_12.797228_5_plen_45_part_00